MKALTIYQPWASLIAVCAKRFETRGWPTNYRGPIAIHAGVRSTTPFLRGLIRASEDYTLRNFALAYKETGLGMMEDLPRGSVIATAELVECRQIRAHCGPFDESYNVLLDGFDVIDISHDEFLFGDWTPGRYAWELANVRPLPQPVPCKGRQGLWNWEGVAA